MYSLCPYNNNIRVLYHVGTMCVPMYILDGATNQRQKYLYTYAVRIIIHSYLYVRIYYYDYNVVSRNVSA